MVERTFLANSYDRQYSLTDATPVYNIRTRHCSIIELIRHCWNEYTTPQQAETADGSISFLSWALMTSGVASQDQLFGQRSPSQPKAHTS